MDSDSDSDGLFADIGSISSLKQKLDDFNNSDELTTAGTAESVTPNDPWQGTGQDETNWPSAPYLHQAQQDFQEFGQGEACVQPAPWPNRPWALPPPAYPPPAGPPAMPLSPQERQASVAHYDQRMTMTVKHATAPNSSKAPVQLKGKTRSNLWCDIYLDENMIAEGFEVEKKIIGKGGVNTRNIFMQTGSKILLCGNGAERGKARQQRGAAQDHLRIAIVSDKRANEAFREAFRMVRQLIDSVCREFDNFCRQRRRTLPAGPRYWIGSAGAGAVHVLSSVPCNLVEGVFVDDPSSPAFDSMHHTTQGKPPAATSWDERRRTWDEKQAAHGDMPTEAAHWNHAASSSWREAEMSNWSETGIHWHAAEPTQRAVSDARWNDATQGNTDIVQWSGPEAVDIDQDQLLKTLIDEPHTILDATPDLYRDHNFMVQAIENNVSVLEHLPREVLSNRVLLEAITRQPAALRYASEDQVLDNGFMFEAIRRNAECLKEVKDLCGSRNFMLDAVQQNPNALLFASVDLLSDNAFLQDAVRYNREALRYAPKDFLASVELR